MRGSELAYPSRIPQTAQAMVVDRSLRLRAGAISLGAAVLIFAAKFAGYRLTRSTAILSDALESIVNIIAALFTLASLRFASRPADENHPYGHGKVEFLSSGFEGGLIAFAALLIVYEAVDALWFGRELLAIDVGLALVIVAGIANALLGYFLVRTGRRTHSPAIEADGQHVLSDFWTSAGVVVGLGLVAATGWQPFDPLVAIALGANLAIVGVRLLRRAVGGLLDESDPGLLAKLASVIQARAHSRGDRHPPPARDPLRRRSPRRCARRRAALLVRLRGARFRRRLRAPARARREPGGRVHLSPRPLPRGVLPQLPGRSLRGAGTRLRRRP